MISPEEFSALREDVREINRQIMCLNRQPCAKHDVQIKWLERVTFGLIGFSGALLLGLITNFDKIKKVFTA